MNSDRVIIIGAGWAGMAAALELEHKGIPVSVFESAPQAGGRARSVRVGNHTLDNGQHLLIGAYSETLRLLAQMGLKESDLLQRQRLQLEVLERNDGMRLATPRLPAPLHLLWGITTATGLAAGDKVRALHMSLQLALRGYRLEEDISVAALLQRYAQSPTLIRRFWEPLCLATLNTPLAKASAQVFLRVLRDSFSRKRSDSDLLIPRVPLGELFCDTAAAYLSQSTENPVRLRCKVTGLERDGGSIRGVTTAAGPVAADDVILATGPASSARLLGACPETAGLAGTIEALGSQPITTVYLHYPQSPPLARSMLGLSGTLSQWVFDRRLCNQPGWLAVVISAQGEHNGWDREKLSGQVQRELAALLPDWPAAAAQSVVIREKRATFECRVGIESLRPGNTTPLQGLWLAGDYTATGYPGTLEGAVRSGVQCARRLIARRHHRH
jgi:squalene-associated FAD-dependent desaturase